MNEILTNKKIINLIDQVGEYFKDLPHLPENIKNFLIKIAPFLALIGGILSLVSALTFFSGFIFYLPNLLTSILDLASAVFLLMAFKPLKEGNFLGWLYLYYSTLVSLIAGFIGVSYAPMSLIWTLIWLVIDLYLLYEIRNGFKKAKSSK